MTLAKSYNNITHWATYDLSDTGVWRRTGIWKLEGYDETHLHFIALKSGARLKRVKALVGILSFRPFIRLGGMNVSSLS